MPCMPAGTHCHNQWIISPNRALTGRGLQVGNEGAVKTCPEYQCPDFKIHFGSFRALPDVG